MKWRAWGVIETKVKVENSQFGPWSEIQYPKIESQIPKSWI